MLESHKQELESFCDDKQGTMKEMNDKLTQMNRKLDQKPHSFDRQSQTDETSDYDDGKLSDLQELSDK